MTTTTAAPEQGALAAEQLQPLLVDLLALRLHAKQAHWNVRGAHFRDVHLELDEVTDELDGWIDETAERLVTLGEPADAQAPTITTGASIPPADAGFVLDLDALASLATAIDSVAGSAREQLAALDVDLVSQDLVVEIIGGPEKRSWMLRSRVA